MQTNTNKYVNKSLNPASQSIYTSLLPETFIYQAAHQVHNTYNTVTKAKSNFTKAPK